MCSRHSTHAVQPPTSLEWSTVNILNYSSFYLHSAFLILDIRSRPCNLHQLLHNYQVSVEAKYIVTSVFLLGFWEELKSWLAGGVSSEIVASISTQNGWYLMRLSSFAKRFFGIAQTISHKISCEVFRRISIPAFRWIVCAYVSLVFWWRRVNLLQQSSRLWIICQRN